MSRCSTLVDGPALALLCLLLSPAAWAQDDAPGGDELPESGPAVEALDTGRRAKGDGDLAAAEVHFQKALSIAERGGKVYSAALEELTYHLPLMRVERDVVTGQWGRAEQRLQALLQQHQSDEKKSRHLVKLIAKLRSHEPGENQGGVYNRPGAGREAVGLIEQILERYQEENGRYPRGYRELNEVLPAGRYPLEDYDIVHYVGRGDAYGLTLRSKKNPQNLLSVQKTGLVE